ncbi:CAP-Gly domain-containing linker protein 4 [Caerostris extrusa]|uniref:CAP-Gly domain-containing linker protein 4 n=1 Tax=Caerostris extrusa TaxID=172846 RepID=A0AAV4UXX5_CAEEX|nr:CAP-Gly domain-containing linker protein 4 [Caerostris extrusa]
MIGGAKVGTLRYCGGTQFAQGIWAGVELEEPLGKNDGTLKGVTYFKCPHNHGIFAPINKISKYDSSLIRNRSPCISRCSPARNISFSKVNVSHVTSKVETGLSSLRRQNSDVIFCFWYGIELDKPQGKNDGSINSVQYFTCSPGYGLFAPPHRVCRIFKNSEDDCSDHDSADFSLMSKSSTDGENGILSPSSPRSTLTHQKSIRKSSRFFHQLSSPSNSQKNCWLTVGINVFVNNEIGIVRYMGQLIFADGTWLGIELRAPKGKNGGTIQGKKLLLGCKPNYGLLVRPNRVTVRGINGAKLLNESS